VVFSVLFDACVFFPAPLRDFLLTLAETELFRARWTDQIHEEWTRNLLLRRPDLNPERLKQTCRTMNQFFPDSLIQGYEDLIPHLTLPDQNDRHVLAAAIRGRCEIIVTLNLKDFPPSVLNEYDIEAQHPDDFVLNTMELGMDSVLSAIRKQRARLKNPPKTAEEYLETLERQGLPMTYQRLKGYVELI